MGQLEILPNYSDHEVLPRLPREAIIIFKDILVFDTHTVIISPHLLLSSSVIKLRFLYMDSV